MPAGMPNLVDIANQKGSDPVVGLIDEVVKYFPEIQTGAARTIRGTSYKTLVCTALPTVGFRNANEGASISKSAFEQRLVQTYILNPRWECDKAVADAHEDGYAAYVALEAAQQMKAAMAHLCSQFYYGTANDSKGHPGLVAMVDATNMVVDAGGTTADTASSVWAVKWGPQDVTWVWGQGGSLDSSDLRVESITDANSKRFTAYVQEMLAYPGLQVGSLYSVGRIRDLTADNGKGLTDALLADLLGKFPIGHAPDVFLMNRRSLHQLRASRTATNATGAPAPFPTEAFGVPILVTDSITSTEALS